MKPLAECNGLDVYVSGQPHFHLTRGRYTVKPCRVRDQQKVPFITFHSTDKIRP